MKAYLPAALTAVVLGLGIGYLQNVMDWSYGALLLASAVAVAVVGGLAQIPYLRRR